MIGKLKKEIKMIGSCKESQWEMSNDYLFTDGEEFDRPPKYNEDGEKLFYPLPEYNLFNVYVAESYLELNVV